jgi:putative pyridoxal-dependent aspartate 1-decarboxylase
MLNKDSSPQKKTLVANWETLSKVFIQPENEEAKTTLIKYMEQILFGLHEFLKKHVGFTEEISLKELAKGYTDTHIHKTPQKKLTEVITDLVQNIAPHAVNVASPFFVAHMTSALPFFMVHLKTIAAALNQNVVKLETSKVFSILEKQVLAKIHRLIYNFDEAFYQTHVQHTDTTLGCFTENGTLANLTAFWVARNKLFPPKQGFAGIDAEGIHAAFNAYGVDRCVILVSRRAHYSIKKAAGVLGIGNENVISLDVDENQRIHLPNLEKILETIFREQPKTRILSVVGIAGATETGTVDPLPRLAEICSRYHIHFHVDAAWGGPTLMSEKYRPLLDGIQHADSVTIDGHKQFYMPMSCGMVYFKDPWALDNIAYHANYIVRPGSVDLGIRSLSGSREANSLILSSALDIMGTEGYALLIDHGIETARAFAAEIKDRANFELVSPPELNILLYRLFPASMKGSFNQSDLKEKKRIHEQLNEINRRLQRLQREAGKSFVSRTTLKKGPAPEDEMVVLRAVIMNPMTSTRILSKILDEQENIYEELIAGTR